MSRTLHSLQHEVSNDQLSVDKVCDNPSTSYEDLTRWEIRASLPRLLREMERLVRARCFRFPAFAPRATARQAAFERFRFPPQRCSSLFCITSTLYVLGPVEKPTAS